MAYIGVSPSNGVRRVHTYTATASQTTFSGAGAEGTSLSYKDSNFVDVYQNGIKLGDADYTSTSGTSIVLAQAASVDDLVVVVAFDVFSVADTVSKADGGTFDGAVSFGGNITDSGDLTIDVEGDLTLDANGADIKLADNGTVFGELTNSSSYLVIKNPIQDQDIQIKGNDGGSEITPVHIDMSQGGFVGMGTTSPSGVVDIQTSSASHALKVTHSENADKNLVTLQHTYAQSSQTATMIQFKDSGGAERGSIKTSGSATAFNTSSDYRLKENLNYDFDATTRLKQLKPCRFNFIVDADTTVDGFIAHEVSSIVPEAITGEKDATETYTDDDGNEQTRIKPQGIDQSKLVPLLVKTIQELEARITALENAE